MIPVTSICDFGHFILFIPHRRWLTLAKVATSYYFVPLRDIVS